MIRHFFLIPFLAILTFPAFARPVSYPGGWTFITENDDDSNSALLHYTLTTHTALGYRYIYDRDTKDAFHGLQMNNLLRRWNMPDAQANIYLQSGVGISQKRGDAEAFTGIETDWETRRYMAMYQNNVMMSPDDETRKFYQVTGFGVAPYLAEFGSLQTFLMLHIKNEPEDDKNWQFTPMVRMYKGSFLVEAGYNVTKDAPMLNAWIRF
jgi:hypothetical protein